MTPRSIDDVLAAHTPGLLALPGVVGTAQGEAEGRPVILVFVVEETDALRASIPDRIEGYAVRIQETGEIRPH
jgi:hypothetical protein